MRELSDLEMQVLRAGAGEEVPGFSWGAWVSACMETLHGLGLIQGESDATPTARGRALLEERWKSGRPAKSPINPTQHIR